MYDVIIVGARVAGASTAMLLARRGLKVLVVDRATFPSDTLSTHQVQLPGVALPISGQCARTQPNPNSRSPKKAGATTLTSGRWEPPCRAAPIPFRLPGMGAP